VQTLTACHSLFKTSTCWLSNELIPQYIVSQTCARDCRQNTESGQWCQSDRGVVGVVCRLSRTGTRAVSPEKVFGVGVSKSSHKRPCNHWDLDC
jgi:hypothetical protein